MIYLQCASLLSCNFGCPNENMIITEPCIQLFSINKIIVTGVVKINKNANVELDLECLVMCQTPFQTILQLQYIVTNFPDQRASQARTEVPNVKNPPKTSSLDVFLRFFFRISAYSNDFRFRSLHALHIQNLSNCCRHNYDQSISRFSKSIFGGFLTFGPTVARIISHYQAPVLAWQISVNMIFNFGLNIIF